MWENRRTNEGVKRVTNEEVVMAGDGERVSVVGRYVRFELVGRAGELDAALAAAMKLASAAD